MFQEILTPDLPLPPTKMDRLDPRVKMRAPAFSHLVCWDFNAPKLNCVIPPETSTTSFSSSSVSEHGAGDGSDAVEHRRRQMMHADHHLDNFVLNKVENGRSDVTRIRSFRDRRVPKV